MSNLENNTTALNALLDAVNSLPSAGSDVPEVELATPNISVAATGVITASITQAAGKVAGGTKSATLSQTTQAEQIITPGTSDQTISAYRYLTGKQTIKGDPNLKPENIVSGVSIFNVVGTAQAGSGGIAAENCTVELDIQMNDAMAFYMYVDAGGFVAAGTTYFSFSMVSVEVLKNTLLVIYAPGNSADSADGAVNQWGNSGDYAALAYWVTGDGYINVY